MNVKRLDNNVDVWYTIGVRWWNRSHSNAATGKNRQLQIIYLNGSDNATSHLGCKSLVEHRVIVIHDWKSK